MILFDKLGFLWDRSVIPVGVMNGILTSHGLDAISVPAAQAKDFNKKMVRFYLE